MFRGYDYSKVLSSPEMRGPNELELLSGDEGEVLKDMIVDLQKIRMIMKQSSSIGRRG